MSELERDLRVAVEAALGEATDRPAPVARVTPVSGGSISPAARLDTRDHRAYFLKWNVSAPAGMFEAEADGLSALRDAAHRSSERVRVPRVVAVDENGPGPAWLLLEFVERGREDGAWGARLGRGMASLHRPDGTVGWHRDNFIGSLPQANRLGKRRPGGTGGSDASGEEPEPAAASSWPVFWTEARIRPQLRAAREGGHFAGGAGRTLERLADRIPAILEGRPDEGPALLHGDLWGRNVFPDTGGRPVLVDPAVYRGDREVDLAMSELFGFPAGFLRAYREARPVDEGYDAYRRDLYQLYYLLVHVNLFGSGYEAGCVRAAERVLAAV